MKAPLHDHIKKQGVAFYTQLVGVVQSIAAGYLIISLANYKPAQLSSAEWILYGLQFIANFQLIVLVWHIHLQHVTIFGFIFGLADSYIPFVLAIAQFFLVIASGPGPTSGALPEIQLWFYALCGFMILAVIAYKNMFDSVRDENENLGTFETIKNFVKWIKIYVAAVAVFCPGIAIWNP